jgi:succinoglycan biosynthesis transport protein ExoP
MNGVPVPQTPQPGPSPAVREILPILRRHRLVLAASLVLGVAAGVLFASLRDPVYEASTLILVEGPSVPSLSAVDFLSGSADARQVDTEMELLRSRALAKQVVDSLRLQLRVSEPAGVSRRELFSHLEVTGDPLPAEFRLVREGRRFALVDEASDRTLGRFAAGERIDLPGAELVLAPGALRFEEIGLALTPTAASVRELVKALEVRQPGQEANLIRVAYSGSDPELARDVPNVLAAAFMAQRESMQKSEARSRVALLRQQLDTLAVQLTSAEERLRGFREAEGVVDPQLEASTQIGHLAQLQAERAALESERASLARLIADLQALETTRGPGDDSPYRRLIAFPTLLRNQATSELLRTLAQAESERAALATRRSAQDPDVRVLDQRIAELESQIKGIASTYLQGLTSQAAEMDATLSQYRSRLAETPSQQVRFARLSRQPQVLGEMYGLLQTRLKEAEIAQAVEDSWVRVVDAADLPAEPTGTNAGVFGGLAGGFALLLALGLVLGREYADSTVRTRADVQAALGVPVLGLIPRVGRGSGARWRSRLLPGARLLPPSRRGGDGEAPEIGGAPASTGTALIVRGAGSPHSLADAYGRMHAGLEFARPDRSSKILIVTSPLPGDGKTTTAINFATTLAESGLKVLLIDADLRRGRIHEAFGAPRGPGLVNLLSETPELEGVLRRVEVGQGQSLRYVTVGSHVANPVHLLGSPVMRELLRVVSQVYDRVIVDTPPLNLFPDAALLANASDGVVVVARAGATPFDALVDSAEQLRQAGARPLGAVLNEVDFRRDALYDRAYEWYRMSDEYAAAAPAAGSV